MKTTSLILAGIFGTAMASQGAWVIADYNFNTAVDADKLNDTALSGAVDASVFDLGAGLNNNTTQSIIDNATTYDDGGGGVQNSIFGEANALGFDQSPGTLANAIIQNDYLEFSIAPEAGRSIDLGELSWVQYRWHNNRTLDEWGVFTSLDGFASTPGAGDAFETGKVSAAVGAWDDESVDFAGTTLTDADTLTIRLYVYGASQGQSSNSNSGFDSFSLTAVPEPSSTALLGLGGLALALRRRRS